METTANSPKPVITTAPVHPDYLYYLNDWNQMDVTVKGEREVKAEGETYLSKTAGMKADAEYGNDHYLAYKLRACYFNYPGDTLMSMMGLFWQKEPQISLPSKMDKMKTEASVDKKTLIDVYKNITYEQILMGRYGLLLDVPDEQGLDVIPQIVEYPARSIVNWGHIMYKGKRVLKFVILDESAYEFDNGMQYVMKNKYRVLGITTSDNDGNDLPEPIYWTRAGEAGDIWTADFDMNPLPDSDERYIFPSIGKKTMPYIPFVAINVSHTELDLEKPPLLMLSNTALALYRGDADYREALYKQAQATLFGTGMAEDTDIKVGASSAVITTAVDATLQFVEVSGAGLSEMRIGLNDLKLLAVSIGVSLLQSTGDQTGESVKRQITVRTASLKTLANTAYHGVTKILRMAAEWCGANPDEVIIQPNFEFSAANENTAALYQTWEVAKDGGMTRKDYYNWCRANGYTNMSFEDWDKALTEIETKINEQKMEAMNQQLKVKQAGSNNGIPTRKQVQAPVTKKPDARTLPNNPKKN